MNVSISRRSFIGGFVSVGTADYILPSVKPDPRSSQRGPIELKLRRRDRSGNILESKELVDPARLAIVVMDMWDYHWCRTARERAASLIPRMNYTLEAARRLGITICFSPTAAMRDLWDTPQLRATKALNFHPMPVPKPLHLRQPRLGGCMCGLGNPCMYQNNVNNQHPDLKMHDGDFIVLETQQMWNLAQESSITHVILIGIHTNMCVQNKPCGVQPLMSRGLRVYLGRDNTDACTGYDGGGSTPDEGTAQVIREIEAGACPTIDLEETLRNSHAWEDDPILDYVRISPWGRKFNDEINPDEIHIELRLPPRPALQGAEIHYTLDRSDPTPSSPVFSVSDEPIHFWDSHLLKAAGFRNGRRVTFISQAEFWQMTPVPHLPDVYLSDLQPPQETVGEKTLRARMDRSVYDTALQNRAQKYAKGLGVQAPSELVYSINPKYKRFVAVGCVDDAIVKNRWPCQDPKVGNLIFEVYVHDRRVVSSPTMVNGEKPWGFDIAIPQGAKQLKLVVRDAENRLADRHASGDWLSAGFIRG